jgi:hypothetical protein
MPNYAIYQINFDVEVTQVNERHRVTSFEKFVSGVKVRDFADDQTAKDAFAMVIRNAPPQSGLELAREGYDNSDPSWELREYTEVERDWTILGQATVSGKGDVMLSGPAFTESEIAAIEAAGTSGPGISL